MELNFRNKRCLKTTHKVENNFIHEAKPLLFHETQYYIINILRYVPHIR